ncbi:MAG: hypothetical protein ABIB79_03035 [archaeon]
MTYETYIQKLVAFDNMDIPLSALHNRIDRKHKKLAETTGILCDEGSDFGFALVNVTYDNKQKARAIKDAVDQFCGEYPIQGRELRKMIAMKRTERETYLEYGLPEGRRISSQDYVAAMIDVGLSEVQARNFYPEVLEISRNLQRLRGKKTTTTGLRKVLIGKNEAY